MNRKRELKKIEPKWYITRDKYGDSMRVWRMYHGPVKKIQGSWCQHRDGAYNQSSCFMITKWTFKELFGYTLRHGKCVETGPI
jgi:hypothetical protein